ncbi:Synaptic vesicle 2-related protein [Triticum urartu]|uniref:Synaptic vesicle 2-related protein n=1 Tax=Triticum urartu TaxID=4572 RepID=M7YM86_TRIUA|nr:Synaptic vesicle 2-related protein [Triticum urartu]
METYTTDDALTAMGFGKLQGLVLVYAGMGWVAEAMEVMLLSFVGPLIREEWKISAQDESLLSSVVFLGMLIGACGWGYVSDKYGRRRIFIFIFDKVMTVSVMNLNLIFLMYDYATLARPDWFTAFNSVYYWNGFPKCFVSKLFMFDGSSLSRWRRTGWQPCVFILVFGVCSCAKSWLLDDYFFLFLDYWHSLGSFTCMGIGLILSDLYLYFDQIVVSTLTWRWLLALTAIPCFLLLPFFGITPESPRYLCAQNRISDATLVLERIAETNQATLPPGVLVYPRDGEVDHSTLTSEADHLLPLREKDCTDDDVISPKSGSAAALRSLLSRKLRRSTLLLWFVFYANSFAYYGLVLLTAQLSNANRSCASGLKYVKSETDASLYKDTFVTSLAEIPGLIASALLVEWFGRKATMWCLLFTCCGFLGPLVFYQSELWTTGLLFGARACAMGSYTVVCLYAPEVFTT